MRASLSKKIYLSSLSNQPRCLHWSPCKFPLGIIKKMMMAIKIVMMLVMTWKVVMMSRRVILMVPT